jgi:predicted dehydrogenase
MESNENEPSRRLFLNTISAGAVGLGLTQLFGCAPKAAPHVVKDQKGEIVPGFEKVEFDSKSLKKYTPVSEKKIRVGLVGYGYCEFAAHFGFQDHPNVEVVAVSDLFPDRVAELAKVTRCSKTYPSLTEMLKDKTIEAVFVATDAPSHARHCIEVLKSGKHVAVAVPATFGSLEEADELFETVKRTGLKYMMYETTSFHADVHAMREIYKADGFGKIIYSEGEYYHYMGEPLPSYKDWRVGLPPQWYTTHATGYHICVTGGSFTEVSCMAMPSIVPHLQAKNNRYQNPFGTEMAMFRTNEGGTSRMGISWDTPGWGGEVGRMRGQKGSFLCVEGDSCINSYIGLEKAVFPDLRRPGLPPGMSAGGHGGSHGHLTHEFVSSILEDRKPLVDVAMALNLTVPGIVAHQSALKGGELLKIPQYTF